MKPARTANDKSTASADFWCRVLLFAALPIGLLALPARADEFWTPAISVVKPDWPAAAAQLKTEIDSQPLAADQFTFNSGRRPRQINPHRIVAISQLNAVTSPIFPGIGLSPVPVLLPFDSALYLSDRQSGAINLLVNPLSGRIPGRQHVRGRVVRL